MSYLKKILAADFENKMGVRDDQASAIKDLKKILSGNTIDGSTAMVIATKGGTYLVQGVRYYPNQNLIEISPEAKAIPASEMKDYYDE